MIRQISRQTDRYTHTYIHRHIDTWTDTQMKDIYIHTYDYKQNIHPCMEDTITFKLARLGNGERQLATELKNRKEIHL